MQGEKLAYRVSEVAELLGMSRSGVYALVVSRTLPSVRLGGSIRVPADALRAWLKEQAGQEQASVSKSPVAERAEAGR